MTHYYSEKQDTKLNLKKIYVTVKGISFKIYTASGVFSKKRLDKGTQLLIEESQIPEKGKILDMGSGTGIVGIAIKKIYPDTNILMSDINERAVMLSKKNIKLHNLKNVRAIKSDLYSEINDKFDTILVNPPQTAGKEVCFRIISGAKEYLKKNGTLQLVARHRKGGASLEKKMKEVFDNVQYIAKSGGYRVYLSRR